MKDTLHCNARFRDLSVLSKTPPPWTHVASLGEFPGEVNIPAGYDVPGYGVLDEDMSVEGLTVFNPEVFKRLTESFQSDILIDADHLSHDTTQATEALGWGVELRYAADGDELELKTPWTPPGRDKIATQVYRYISPEFAGAVRFEDDVFKFYPSELVGAGLTNRPKLTVLRPVSANRSGGSDRSKLIVLLCRVLGVPESTPEDDLETKAAKFVANSKNRAGKGPDALEEENKKLRCEVKILRDESIENDLERYADVIEDKDSARELLQMNRASTVKFFKAAQAKRGVQSHAPQPLYQKNRATAPDGRAFSSGGEDNTAAQRSLVATVQNREKCNFTTAWNIAKSEKPELF